ncbi:MAG: ankyrin repeat domain-containing protein [Rickettsiales bacterium]|nr:ankyrin repeat domain-containing protein [Rickettsiales bacterium]
MLKNRSLQVQWVSLFVILFLSIFYDRFCCANPLNKSPKVINPSFVSLTDRNILPKKQDIKNSTYNTVQLAYFIKEITNFIDKDPSVYFYDYINPNIPEQAFISNSFNIYKKILLLKDIEKSPKEQAAIQDIARFSAINYKTQTLPAYVHVDNPHLPKPLYLSQLAYNAFQSIKTGDRDALHALVNNYHLLSVKDKLGNSLLITAILHNRNNMAKFLISKGANVNLSNEEGMTPIMIAAKMKNFEVANFLIKKNCNLKKLDNSGNSALDYVAENKNSPIYLLIKKNLKKQNMRSRTRARRSKKRHKL